MLKLTTIGFTEKPNNAVVISYIISGLIMFTLSYYNNK